MDISRRLLQYIEENGQELDKYGLLLQPVQVRQDLRPDGGLVLLPRFFEAYRIIADLLLHADGGHPADGPPLLGETARQIPVQHGGNDPHQPDRPDLRPVGGQEDLSSSRAFSKRIVSLRTCFCRFSMTMSPLSSIMMTPKGKERRTMEKITIGSYIQQIRMDKGWNQDYLCSGPCPA